MTTSTRAAIRELTAELHDRFLPLRRSAREKGRRLTAELREHTDGGEAFQFSERVLQILWNEQRFRVPLVTAQGQSLEVVSPGTWNVSAGPDFRHALLRLDGQLRRGAVEVHISEADWQRHGHDTDPAYDEVVLHVVWTRDAGAAEPRPCLVASDWVEQPWRLLLEQVHGEPYPYARQVAPGACALQWALSEDAAVVRILNVAGLARMEDKALRLRQRIVLEGADQALYEGLFEALGYKANQASFRTLAERLPVSILRAAPGALEREALLFGTADLLPDPTRTPVLRQLRDRLDALWDRWWQTGRHRGSFTWVRAGARPYNSPERRLAAGAILLKRMNLTPSRHLQALANGCDNGAELLRALRALFAFESPWDGAAGFGTALARPARLVGKARALDIIVNILLPFLLAQGCLAGDERLQDLAREAFTQAPATQTNRIIREACHRFLVPPSRGRELLTSACAQQGIMEIYRSFCLVLHADCQNCPLAGRPRVAVPGDEAYSVSLEPAL